MSLHLCYTFVRQSLEMMNEEDRLTIIEIVDDYVEAIMLRVAISGMNFQGRERVIAFVAILACLNYFTTSFDEMFAFLMIHSIVKNCAERYGYTEGVYEFRAVWLSYSVLKYIYADLRFAEEQSLQRDMMSGS
jgi:hypothetical protein